MKTNELMIEDWVCANRSECVADGGRYQKWQQIGKVKYIQEDVVAVRFDEEDDWEDDWEEFSLNEVNPIPLTEEILVKNGFEYAYNEVSKMQNKQLLVANIGGHYIEVRLDKKNVAIWYDYDENESGFYSDVLLELPRTVHTLQHLLRLCGIEKELTI